MEVGSSGGGPISSPIGWGIGSLTGLGVYNIGNCLNCSNRWPKMGFSAACSNINFSVAATCPNKRFLDF